MKISKTMQAVLDYAKLHDGTLCRFNGGYWAKITWKRGERPWFGTTTIAALVSRGLLNYTQFQWGENYRFPIEAKIVER